MRQVGVPGEKPARGLEESPETMQTRKWKGVEASAVEVGETMDRADIHRGNRMHPWLRVQPAGFDSCFGPWRHWSTYL